MGASMRLWLLRGCGGCRILGVRFRRFWTLFSHTITFLCRSVIMCSCLMHSRCLRGIRVIAWCSDLVVGTLIVHGFAIGIRKNVSDPSIAMTDRGVRLACSSSYYHCSAASTFLLLFWVPKSLSPLIFYYQIDGRTTK